MVFARAVLLVEGFGEEVLVPTMADRWGWTSTNSAFRCARSTAHTSGPTSVLQSARNPVGGRHRWGHHNGHGTTGQARAQALLTELGRGGTPAENGIFVGDNTFEYDFAGIEDNHGPCYDVLTELCAAPSQATVESWKELSPDYKSFMKVVTNAGGKGRYAQRLALRAVKPPAYIAEALSYLAP